MKKEFLLSRVYFILIAFGILLAGCSNFDIEDFDTQSNLSKDNTEDFDFIRTKAKSPDNITNWRDQLRIIMNARPEIMSKSNITLKKYEEIGVISDDLDKQNVETSLSNESNMYPLYSDDFKTVKGVSKSCIKGEKLSNYTFDKRDDFIKNYVQKGMKTLRLVWDNNGMEETTTCVVCEKKGVIYDNFISNCMVIKEIKSDLVKINKINESPIIKTRSEPGNSGYTGGLMHSEGITATWLWGSDRGEAGITHTGYYSQGNFTYHNYNAYHSMTIGNSDAQIQELDSKRVAYGYALSTPAISITLSFTGSSYSLSFSTMLGSTGGSTGAHAFPATY